MSEPVSTHPSAVSGPLLDHQEKMIVLGLSGGGGDYQLHLAVDEPLTANPVGQVVGTLHAHAKRVDVVSSGGGRYIEPVMGRPRRVQGRVVAGDHQANTLQIHAGAGMIEATLMLPQKTADFSLGQTVTFSVMRGATFQPV